MIFDPSQDGNGKALFVAGHGAGSHKEHPSMRQLSSVLTRHGFDVVRFNFDYREKGSRVPDRMPRLQARFSAVLKELAPKMTTGKKLILGGRSMGGRIASMLAAEGFACDGLLLFAYPLHPAGKPERLRDAHLPKIRLPVLCFNGTRDALCQKDLMAKAIDGLGWDMHWIEGADHSFAMTEAIGELAGRWLARLPGIFKFSAT